MHTLSNLFIPSVYILYLLPNAQEGDLLYIYLDDIEVVFETKEYPTLAHHIPIPTPGIPEQYHEQVGEVLSNHPELTDNIYTSIIGSTGGARILFTTKKYFHTISVTADFNIDFILQEIGHEQLLRNAKVVLKLSIWQYSNYNEFATLSASLFSSEDSYNVAIDIQNHIKSQMEKRYRDNLKWNLPFFHCWVSFESTSNSAI